VFSLASILALYDIMPEFVSFFFIADPVAKVTSFFLASIFALS